MTNYTACCCRVPEVVGWRIAASSVINISSNQRRVQNNGRVQITAVDMAQTLAVQMERGTGTFALTDVGSEVSGVVYKQVPAGDIDQFTRRTIIGFTDLNDDTGQTWPNGSPIFRTPATLPTTAPLFSFDWPTGSTGYDFECLGLVDQTVISSRIPETGGGNLPFDESTFATFEVFKETNQPFQPPESTEFFRFTPIGNAQGTAIVVPFGIYPLPSVFPVIDLFGSRRYRDFSSFGQFDLEDLGIDDGITELPFGFDPTNSEQWPSISLSIDGQDISPQELLDFSDDVRCLFRTSQSITLSYVLVNIFNSGFPTDDDFIEYELTASMDQNIDSLEYIFG